MPFLNKFHHWKLNKSRTEAFSDGVFAILITLLILEIKVPHLSDKKSSNELLWALKDLLPKIISWAVSFFFIAVFWVQHHNLFRLPEKIDYGLVSLNNITLFFICFLPFPTALMGEYPENRIAVLMFGAIATCASFSQTYMYYYVAQHFLPPKFDKVTVMKNMKRSFMLAPLLIIVAASVSYINLTLCYIIYGIVPLFFLLPFDKEEEVN
ncbi:MAG: TMEM175 family protein [Bacteroidota bacterium]